MDRWTVTAWQYALDGKSAGIEFEVFQAHLMDKYGYTEEELEGFAFEFVMNEVRPLLGRARA